MKVFFDGLAMWREWRMTGLLRGSRSPGSRPVGRMRKRWIDTLKDCLKKRGLDFGQPRIFGHDRSVWRGFVWRNAQGVARGMNPSL